jgi:MFS family permease
MNHQRMSAIGTQPLGVPASIIVVSAQTAPVFALTTLPTPLYRDYARAFGSSVLTLTLTLIYATYVVGTLSTLFLLGRLSDKIGRSSVALAALGLAALAALVFASATNTPMLFIGRALTGFAAGLSSGPALVSAQTRGDRAMITSERA